MAAGTFKDPHLERRIFQRRVAVVIAAGVVMLLVLLARMFYLQVINYDHYITLSQNNRISILPIAPVRGLIIDRSGVVFAQNIPAYTIEIVPDQVPDLDRLLAEIGEMVQLTPADLERFHKQRRQRPGFESIPLRDRLSDVEAARYAVNRYRLQGSELRARLQRYYPLGELGVHLVGYVGRISPSDLEKVDKRNYRGLEYIGKLGVEASYEDTLRGQAGVEQIETNAHGRRVRLLSRSKPVAGRNLHLNVDARLQKVAEEALGNYRGAVVAIDPRTGGVLTFVSMPTYDPNPFVNGIDEESYGKLRDSFDRPLINRALAGRYAPGSTIKGFLGLAALEFGRNPARHTLCPGYFSLRHSSHRYRCWRKAGHGAMELRDAIVQSCDVYFYDLAAEMGIEKLHDYLDGFGFGRDTGVDLIGEVDGLNPSPEWKQRVHRQPWYPGETVNSGIGQGYTLVTPLQLASAMSIIATRGVAAKPHVVYAVEDRVSGREEILPPRSRGLEPVHDAGHYDLVIGALQDVVHSDRGTARRISYGAKYKIAGKTGTAQVIGIGQDERYDEDKIAEHLRDHALFIAFAPVDDPKIAVAVIAENGGHGGSTAAPIARKVMDFYLGEILPEAERPPALRTPAAAAGKGAG